MRISDWSSDVCSSDLTSSCSTGTRRLQTLACILRASRIRQRLLQLVEAGPRIPAQPRRPLFFGHEVERIRPTSGPQVPPPPRPPHRCPLSLPLPPCRPPASPLRVAPPIPTDLPPPLPPLPR